MEKEVKLRVVKKEEKDPGAEYGDILESLLSSEMQKQMELDNPIEAAGIKNMLVSMSNAMKGSEGIKKDFGCIMRFGVDRLKRQVVVEVCQNITTGKSRLEIKDNPDVYGRGQYDTLPLDSLWIDKDIKPVMFFLDKNRYILKSRIPTKIKLFFLDESGNVYTGYISLTRY